MGLVDIKLEGDIAVLTMKSGKNEITFEFLRAMNEAMNQVLQYRSSYCYGLEGVGFSNE